MSDEMKDSTVRNFPTLPQSGKIGDDPQPRGNRTHQHYRDTAVGDGAKTVFFLSKSPTNDAQCHVYVSGLLKTPSASGTANDYTLSGNKVTFVAAPALNAPISFLMVSS